MRMKHLRAALLFAANKDVRYYLNAIYFCGNDIKASDGHTLLHITEKDSTECSTGTLTPVIIGRDTIDSFIKLVTATLRASKQLSLLDERAFTIDPISKTLHLDYLPHVRIGYDPVEGRYPDTDRVWPKGEDLIKSETWLDEPVCTGKRLIDPAYHSRALKALDILGHTKGNWFTTYPNYVGRESSMWVWETGDQYEYVRIGVMPVETPTDQEARAARKGKV